MNSYFSDEQSVQLTSIERRLLVWLFLLIAGFILVDLFEDWVEGLSWAHIGTEAFLFVISLLGASILWYKSLNRLSGENAILSRNVTIATEDAGRWKDETATLLAGLGKAIDLQFTRWNLTAAEKDVSLFILKGLSHKEIAQIRGTAEKTIRLQAASAYNKANVENRAQLSAFFLEDLLLPS